MSTYEYVKFIDGVLKSDGVKVADIMNKKALEAGAITQSQYSKAAQIIVQARLSE